MTDSLILFPQLLRLFWDGCFDLQMLRGLFFKAANVPGSTVEPMLEMDTSFSLGGSGRARVEALAPTCVTGEYIVCRGRGSGRYVPTTEAVGGRGLTLTG